MTTVMEKFVSKFKKDGLDHIRVSTFADTPIGRMAASEWRKRFYIPHVGVFLSPVCFANWLITGDEEARHNPKFRVKATVRGYHNYIMYAKFYQLCGMRSSLTKEMKHLPFASYKVHQTGIKEFDRWKDYSSTVKEMIEHVIDPARGAKVPFAWEKDVTAEVNAMIAAIAAAGGHEPDVETTGGEDAPVCGGECDAVSVDVADATDEVDEAADEVSAGIKALLHEQDVPAQQV